MILIGAGGHAKTLIESFPITGYIDPNHCDWLDVPQLPEDYDLACRYVVIGFVGLTPAALQRRSDMLQSYLHTTAGVPSVIHGSAIVSRTAIIEEGVQILPGAIINSHAIIRQGAIINSGAIVEHDAVIEPGAHIAPHATVLGGAKIGQCSFIGANAIVIQGQEVPQGTFVKAGAVYHNYSRLTPGHKNDPSGVHENLATLLHGG